MSHEIRTPMNGIIGVVELLQKTSLTIKQLQLLELMHTSGSSLLVIINDILDISKIEAGKLILDVSEFSLRELLDNVVALLGVRAQERNIELFSSLSVQTPELVIGDSTRVQQILINLVGNSLKFTNHGYIHIRVASKRLDSHIQLCFEIFDTGIGIPDDRIPKLFQPFEQATTAISSAYGGTGLGLVITKRLIESMNDSIRAESHVGQGSKFIFEIMLEACEQPTPILQIPEIQPWNILVRDSLPWRQTAIKEFLSVLGCQAATTAKPCDLLILDESITNCKIKSERFILLKSLPTGLLHTNTDSLHAKIIAKPMRWKVLFETLESLSPSKPTITHHPHSTEKKILPQLGLQILVVEDNPINQKVIRLMLESIGCSAEIAHHGGEALQYLRKKAFTLCLMDCNMPIFDGFEATQQIRVGKAGESVKNIPIIALSAGALLEKRKRCFDTGMDDFIAKPVSIDLLWNKLFQWSHQT